MAAKVSGNLQKGTGRCVYRNNTKGDLTLPKPSENGTTGPIPPGGTWIGDDYFMYMVKNNEASLVENLVVNPEIVKEEVMDKLILDQPDRITTEGRVERVVVSQTLPLNETPLESTDKDVLLTEDPMDGIQIILND